jgi:hypothetical protein
MNLSLVTSRLLKTHSTLLELEESLQEEILMADDDKEDDDEENGRRGILFLRGTLSLPSSGSILHSRVESIHHWLLHRFLDSSTNFLSQTHSSLSSFPSSPAFSIDRQARETNSRATLTDGIS